MNDAVRIRCLEQSEGILSTSVRIMPIKLFKNAVRGSVHVTTDFSSGIQRSNSSLAASSFSNPAHRTTGATGTSTHSQPSTQASLSSLFQTGGRKPATKNRS